ncbi:MAG: hypothetical protein WD032_03515 [Nitrospirales bacterium]
MKKYYLYLVSLLLLPNLAQASSYAPLADFSAVRQNAQCQLTTLHESFLKSWTPPANFFMVPAYPHAKLVSAFPSGTANIKGKTYQTFPSAVLLSPDSPETIIAFYTNRLGRGWYQIEDHGIIYVYRMPRPVESGEALTQHLMNRPGYTPHVAIDTDLKPCDRALAAGARTRITVVVAPR